MCVEVFHECECNYTGQRSSQSVSVSSASVHPCLQSVHDSYDSSVCNHLIADDACRVRYSDSCFTVLSRGRSFQHLKVLEAIYIHTTHPSICKQVDNTLTLKLFVD